MFSPLRAISSIAQSLANLGQDPQEDWGRDSELDGETLASATAPIEQLPLPEMNYQAPIFLVDGFMSFEVMGIWNRLITHFRVSSAEEGMPCPKIQRLLSGGVASSHDTAVSLFYQIKGGREDFGMKHSLECGHDRYGHDYAGLYPEWSADRPVHILAHSLGGNALMELQRLLEKQFFVDEHGQRYQTSASWVISASFLSSPLRGTQTTYILGATPGDPAKLNPLSVGRALYFCAQLWEWLDWDDTRKGWLGIHFRLSHFGFARNRSIMNLAKGLFGPSLFDKGLDNSSADAALVQCAKTPYETHAGTYYRSYATVMTREDVNGKEVPIKHFFPFLSDLAGAIGSYDFKKSGNGLLDSFVPRQTGWHKNDGVCPLISQVHPLDCDYNHCTHFDLPPPHKSKVPNLPYSLRKGHWYSSTIMDCSHIDLIPGIDPPSPPKALTATTDFLSHMSKVMRPVLDLHQETSPEPVPDYWLPHYREAFMTDYALFISKVNASLRTKQ